LTVIELNSFPPLFERLRHLLSNDIEVYLVGGALRDLLLGQPTHDFDFIMPNNALKIARYIANELNAAYFPIDPERQIGRVILTKEDGERFVLDFAVFQGTTLESDLRLRDFTINALAIDLRNPLVLIDPLKGVLDVKEKKLRMCSPDAMRLDPVRVLRGVRLAIQLGFQILPETLVSMRQAVALLPKVSSERIRDELIRILDGTKPDSAMRVLDSIGVLEYILPEIPTLKGLAQSTPHVNDAWNHTLSAMSKLEQIITILNPEYDEEKAASLFMGLISLYLGRYREHIHKHLKEYINRDRTLKPLLFLAALYHDTGKPYTQSIEKNGRIRFIHHEEIGEKLIEARARQLHFSNHEIKRLQWIVRAHMRPILLAHTGKSLTPRTIYRYFRDLDSIGVDVCLIALADVLATYEYTLPQDIWLNQIKVVRSLLEAWYERKEKLISPPPLVSGNDLMEEFQLVPGPLIGYLLDKIREAQIMERIRTRNDALNFAQELLKHPPKKLMLKDS
jgi:tRNA nucleotidyltransferase/poly(A) polymerase